MFGKKADPEGKSQLTKKDVAEMLAHCKCGKKADFKPIPWRVESAPTQRIKDKIGRNHAWDVTYSTFDPKTKTVSIEHIAGTDKTETTNFPYEAVCAEFGWKSFTLSEDEQTVYPKW